MDMLKGLTNKAPAPVDASMKLPGKNINEGATRDGVAATPKTLGPRTA